MTESVNVCAGPLGAVYDFYIEREWLSRFVGRGVWGVDVSPMYASMDSVGRMGSRCALTVAYAPVVSYAGRMCVGCAMAAASAASGLRTWLQTRHLGWLTPKRMRTLTIGAMCAAGLVSAVGVSGSTPPQSHTAGHGSHATHSEAR